MTVLCSVSFNQLSGKGYHAYCINIWKIWKNVPGFKLSKKCQKKLLLILLKIFAASIEDLTKSFQSCNLIWSPFFIVTYWIRNVGMQVCKRQFFWGIYAYIGLDSLFNAYILWCTISPSYFSKKNSVLCTKWKSFCICKWA